MSRYVLLFAFFAAVAFASTDDTTSDSSSSEENPNCPKNEEWAICGRICEPRCCMQEQQFCQDIECTKSMAGCRCKDNFVRNEKQQCVSPAQCTKTCETN